MTITKQRRRTTNVARKTPSPLTPERIARFLVRLPMSREPVDWLHRFRELLVALCGDVDRIALQVNINCEISTSLVPVEILHLVQTFHEHERADFNDVSVQDHPTRTPAELVLAEIKRAGFPSEQYHDPVAFKYEYSNGSYLGVMLLFRDRRRQPVGDQTRRLIADLEPFMLFILSSYVARYNVYDPRTRVFTTALSEIYHDYGLTRPELAVLTLQGMGFTYEQIAKRLLISKSIVGRRVGSIREKTGCNTFAGLFARYIRNAVDGKRSGDCGMLMAV